MTRAAGDAIVANEEMRYRGARAVKVDASPLRRADNPTQAVALLDVLATLSTDEPSRDHVTRSGVRVV